MSEFHLLERFGIELEYMVVNKDSMEVSPIVDKLLKDVAGKYVQEIDRPRVNWSNELALHVVEVKNKNPESDICDLIADFQLEVKNIFQKLESYNCLLLPSAVHPWMNPDTAKLWPHSNREVYNTFDRIFGCKGHGWSNLQSMHINISFHGDEEFHQLHSAIRVVLPLIPAICSSSPVIDGKRSEYDSARLSHYLKNQKKIPSIIGDVIPEPVNSQKEYQQKILGVMYKDISQYDPEGILQHEWLNSRGAIAKFNYGCIEIRIADVQEAPIKDLATAQFFTKIIEAIVKGNLIDLQQADMLTSSELKQILVSSAHQSNESVIENQNYLNLFGLKGPMTSGDVLNHFYEKLNFTVFDSHFHEALKHNLIKGPLSKRLLRALNGEFSKNHLKETYMRLSHCLKEGSFFEA